jgi:hypothetical protein
MDGKPLRGPDYVTQLFAGPDADSLTPQAEPIPFRTDPESGWGYFPLKIIVLDFVERGETFAAQLRVWNITVAPTFEEARAAGKGNKGVFVGAALELRDGAIVTGKNSPLMHAASALVLNAVKTLAGIPYKIPLLSPSIIESVGRLKKDVFGARSVSLDLSEVLICLSINAASNPMAHLALEKMKELQGCEVHITHIPTAGDDSGLRRPEDGSLVGAPGGLEGAEIGDDVQHGSVIEEGSVRGHHQERQVDDAG